MTTLLNSWSVSTKSRSLPHSSPCRTASSSRYSFTADIVYRLFFCWVRRLIDCSITPLENGACVHRQHFAGVYNIFLAPGTLSGTIRLSPLFFDFFFLLFGPGKVEGGPISFLNGNFFFEKKQSSGACYVFKTTHGSRNPKNVGRKRARGGLPLFLRAFHLHAEEIGWALGKSKDECCVMKWSQAQPRNTFQREVNERVRSFIISIGWERDVSNHPYSIKARWKIPLYKNK